MKTYKIAVIPGDGIGPEVTSSAVSVLKKVGELEGISFEFTECDAGGCAIDKHGIPLPFTTLETCRASDAVLLGAVGGPRWDSVEPAKRPERALLGLRSGLGLYSNLRPALMFKELASASPVKNVESMDILIVRELTGGIYFGKHGQGCDCLRYRRVFHCGDHTNPEGRFPLCAGKIQEADFGR